MLHDLFMRFAGGLREVVIHVRDPERVRRSLIEILIEPVEALLAARSRAQPRALSALRLQTRRPAR